MLRIPHCLDSRLTDGGKVKGTKTMKTTAKKACKRLRFYKKHKVQRLTQVLLAPPKRKIVLVFYLRVGFRKELKNKK
jgi:hypothetical protein